MALGFKSHQLNEKVKKIATSRTFSFGIGYVSFLGGRLLRDLLLARVLGTNSYGLWAALNILRQYANYSDVGLLNGLARELPAVKEDQQKSEQLASHAAFGTLIGTVIVLFWLSIAKPEGFVSETVGWIAVVLMLVFICLEKVYKYFNSVLLGFDEVKKAGQWLAFLSVLDLFLAVAGAYWAGVTGLICGTVLAVAVTSFAMSRKPLVRINLNFSLPILKKILMSSFLLMCFGLLNIALHNIDRTMFLFINGPDAVLGSYHAASLLALAVSVGPFIITSVANPKVYALSSNSDEKFYEILKTSGLVCCLLAALGGGGRCFSFKWGIASSIVSFASKRFRHCAIPYFRRNFLCSQYDTRLYFTSKKQERENFNFKNCGAYYLDVSVCILSQARNSSIFAK